MRISICLLTLLLAPALSAQVYSNLKASDLQRDKPEVSKPDDNEPAGVDQAERRKKLKEAFTLAMSEETIADIANTSSVNGRKFVLSFDSKKGKRLIDDYFMGRVSFAAEDFSEAERRLSRAEAHEIEAGDSRGALKYHRQVQLGGAIELRAHAILLAEFDITIDASRQSREWEGLERDIEKIRKDYTDLIEDAQAGENQYSAKSLEESQQRFEARVAMGATPWIRLARSYSNALEKPHDPDAVWKVIEDCSDTQTRLNIRMRSALSYLIKHFPEYDKVADGSAAMLYAKTFVDTLEFESAVKELDQAMERTAAPEVRKALREERRKIQGALDTLKEDLLED